MIISYRTFLLKTFKGQEPLLLMERCLRLVSLTITAKKKSKKKKSSYIHLVLPNNHFQIVTASPVYVKTIFSLIRYGKEKNTRSGTLVPVSVRAIDCPPQELGARLYILLQKIEDFKEQFNSIT